MQYVSLQCSRSPVVTLTLARYLLELSLLEYKFISYRESIMAASCLYIARRMQNEGNWVVITFFMTCLRVEYCKYTYVYVHEMNVHRGVATYREVCGEMMMVTVHIAVVTNPQLHNNTIDTSWLDIDARDIGIGLNGQPVIDKWLVLIQRARVIVYDCCW